MAVFEQQDPIETIADRVKAKWGTGTFAAAVLICLTAGYIVTLSPVGEYLTAHERVMHSEPTLSWNSFSADLAWTSSPVSLAITFPTPVVSRDGTVTGIWVEVENRTTFVRLWRIVTPVHDEATGLTTVTLAEIDFPGYASNVPYRFRLCLAVSTKYDDKAPSLYGPAFGNTVAP